MRVGLSDTVSNNFHSGADGEQSVFSYHNGSREALHLKYVDNFNRVIISW